MGLLALVRRVLPRALRKPRASLTVVGYEKQVFLLTGHKIKVYRTNDAALSEKMGRQLVIQQGDDIIFRKEGATQIVSRTPVVLEWNEAAGTYAINGKPLNDGDVFGSGEAKRLFVFKKMG